MTKSRENLNRADDLLVNCSSAPFSGFSFSGDSDALRLQKNLCPWASRWICAEGRMPLPYSPENYRSAFVSRERFACYQSRV
jgi:hypothetical protein